MMLRSNAPRLPFEIQDTPGLFLMYIRDQRNQIIHQGLEVENAERLMNELKTFVEGFLRFVIEQSGKFAKH